MPCVYRVQFMQISCSSVEVLQNHKVKFKKMCRNICDGWVTQQLPRRWQTQGSDTPTVQEHPVQILIAGEQDGRTFCNFLQQSSEGTQRHTRHGRGSIWVMLTAHYIMEDASWLNKWGGQLELSEVLNTDSKALKYSFCTNGFLCFCHSFTVNQLLSPAASWGSGGAAAGRQRSLIYRNIIFMFACTFKSMFAFFLIAVPPQGFSEQNIHSHCKPK